MPAVWGNYLTPLQGDFLDRYVMLDRVSNLITTRSDGFIMYLLLEGYRNAGTAGATLEVSQRSASYVDLSAVTPTNPMPTVKPIPTR